ncbi:MAG TPA: sulfatase-like hydrolase/transferase, partial [Thermoleophilaceae bacterium]
APRLGTQPTYKDHPQSLFTLLYADHRMNVHEEVTQMCPPRMCGPHGSTNVIERLSHGRVARFNRALDGIRGGDPPVLTFVHAFFPHEPRQYLPSGASYQAGPDLEPALDGPPSFTNEWLTEQSLQRTLLQMMFTDTLVGRLVKRLKDTRQWDKSLLVITADHGESFQRKRTPAKAFKVGHLHWRRAVSSANLGEIAPVPLFVKYPDQREGQVDPRFVKTIDVLPTIADVTQHPATWSLAGRSLRDPDYKGQAAVSVAETFGGAVSMPADRWLLKVADFRRRTLSLFPARAGIGPIYGIGPRPDLGGRPLSDFTLLPRGQVHATLYKPERWRDVHTSSWLLPLHVTGRITGGNPDGRKLAVAVNGVIVATGWGFRPMGATRWSISILIPQSVLRSGRNDVRIYEPEGQSTLRRLA